MTGTKASMRRGSSSALFDTGPAAFVERKIQADCAQSILRTIGIHIHTRSKPRDTKPGVKTPLGENDGLGRRNAAGHKEWLTSMRRVCSFWLWGYSAW